MQYIDLNTHTYINQSYNLKKKYIVNIDTYKWKCMKNAYLFYTLYNTYVIDKMYTVIYQQRYDFWGIRVSNPPWYLILSNYFYNFKTKGNRCERLTILNDYFILFNLFKHSLIFYFYILSKTITLPKLITSSRVYSVAIILFT